MPHKHKRTRVDDDDNQYELPPSEKARPLTTSKGALFSDSTQKKASKRKRSDDDTPAAFKRLMAYKTGALPRSGLDNGTTKAKKKRPDVQAADVLEKTTPIIPKIRPGERMNDFSSRVDAALPMNGLAKKGPIERNADGTRKVRSKAQKRQQNMQKEWREIDARYKEKLAEAEEEAKEEYDGIWRGIEESGSKKKRRKRTKGGQDDEGDLWASVGKDRQASSNKLVGIHDVVDNVPKFTVAPREKMKIKNGAMVDIDSVPQLSGSLRRREELNGSRRQIIAAYRNLVRTKSSMQSI